MIIHHLADPLKRVALIPPDDGNVIWRRWLKNSFKKIEGVFYFENAANQQKMKSLFKTKSIESIIEDAKKNSLKRTMGSFDLVLLGIGCMIGSPFCKCSELRGMSR